MNDNSWFTHYFIKVNLRSIHNIYITKLVGLSCGEKKWNHSLWNVNTEVDAFDKRKTVILSSK